MDTDTAMFRCPHAYPSASSPFTLKKLTSRGNVSIGAEASNWAVFDGWLAGQPVFLGTTSDYKGRLREMRVFQQERWWDPKEEDLEGGDCWLDSDSFWAN